MEPSIESIIIVFASFALTAVLTPLLTPYLHRLKFSQTERKEGVEAHLKKAGTPTMGGLAILAGILVPALIAAGRHPRIIPVMVLTLGFGLIGLIDDYLKVTKRASDGLSPRQKMLGEFLLTAVFVVYLWLNDERGLSVIIPFTGGRILTGTAVAILMTPLVFLAVLGTVNAVNFTDGVDGLASSVTCVVAVFLISCSVSLGADLEVMGAAVLGALMGFLLFNAHPATIFMGDTGSLALGGFVAGMACLMSMHLYILIFGAIYLAEILSVMIQVTYFKKTGGKRIFRMTPIHHHFELGGWSETRIVTVFTIVTVLLCLVAWMGL